MEDLKLRSDKIFNGLVNPRAGLLLQALPLRLGKSLSSKGNPLSVEESAKILSKADAELQFETFRRTLPEELNTPSRLTCLFLCEDDEQLEGRLTIQDMFSKKSRPYICKVKIVDQLGLARADCRWYDAYLTDPQEKFIEKYWSGEPFDETPRWEYLLEGSISLTSEEEIAHVLANGKFKT